MNFDSFPLPLLSRFDFFPHIFTNIGLSGLYVTAMFHLPCVAKKRAVYDKYGKKGLHGMLIWISGYYM